ncbi:UNVERIFIED_CONTAM: hypothetical protein FKN15_035196 [Acipenser sinensis]
MSLIQACRSLALSTWLLSFCFVHLLCLDFTVAEKEEWYTAFVNITYVDPVSSDIRTEKTECGRYGEHSLKQDTKGVVVMPSSPHDRFACDPNTRFAVPANAKSWVALIPKGNCTYRDKVRHVTSQNASAVVIFNVGSSNVNETITMPHAGNTTQCGNIIMTIVSQGVSQGCEEFRRQKKRGSRSLLGGEPSYSEDRCRPQRLIAAATPGKPESTEKRDLLTRWRVCDQVQRHPSEEGKALASLKSLERKRKKEDSRSLRELPLVKVRHRPQVGRTEVTRRESEKLVRGVSLGLEDCSVEWAMSLETKTESNRASGLRLGEVHELQKNRVWPGVPSDSRGENLPFEGVGGVGRLEVREVSIICGD